LSNPQVTTFVQRSLAEFSWTFRVALSKPTHPCPIVLGISGCTQLDDDGGDDDYDDDNNNNNINTLQ
jgi:hypothetical protein